MKKEITVIGLGKMGGNLALNLIDHKWDVYGFNRTSSVTEEFEKQGLKGIYDFKEIVVKLETPRVVWTMLTAGEATQNILFGENGLINVLEKGDIVVEGGNSFYKDDVANFEKFKEKGIHYIDAGVSGGPVGARSGACLMVGGEKETFDYLEELFRDISVENGYKFFEGHGAGHFVKMVHNGIEYGMMQAIAEGFNIMKNSDYDLNLVDVADIYNHKSVIESRLVNWAKEGFEKYGQDLDEIKSEVEMLGEGEWTVKTAKEMGLEIPVIEASYKFRLETKEKPSFTGKVLSMLRSMFGGHKAS